MGVVVLDFGRPANTGRAVASARAASPDVRVLIVENGAGSGAPSDADHLRLPENRGFAGGMNAGLKQLLAEGCDPLLLLNNDAELEPASLHLLANALADPALAAVGPVILRASDGRVESRGVSVDLRWGRVRLTGQGEAPPEGSGLQPVAALSGAVFMVAREALGHVGLLDEDYFFSFEDVDWCLRARRAGFRLGVVLDARARHVGSSTIGTESASRLYYAARNHVRFLDKHRPFSAPARWTRRLAVLGLNLAFALRQSRTPRLVAARAVLRGVADASRSLLGGKTGG